MAEKKRILFIGTKFYTYHEMIRKELEAQGFLVDYYADRPSESSLMKGFIKINKNLVRKQTAKYFENLLAQTRSKHYDLVFMMNCKVYTKKMIEALKMAHESAEFVLYLWDSVKLYPFVGEFIHLFNRAYTFDLDDSEANKKLKLLPLFYDKEYEEVAAYKSETQVDLVSICTAHPIRYRIIKDLFPRLKEDGIRIFSFFYINKLQYLYNKVFEREFRHASRKEFSFEPLESSEIVRIIKGSDTVFDIPHDQQSGLTMRTIETLGAKRKLITTNRQISRYDFYDENNILILDDSNYIEVSDFIRRAYKEIPEEIYRSYSLSSWVSNITEEKTMNFMR